MPFLNIYTFLQMYIFFKPPLTCTPKQEYLASWQHQDGRAPMFSPNLQEPVYKEVQRLHTCLVKHTV